MRFKFLVGSSKAEMESDGSRLLTFKEKVVPKILLIDDEETTRCVLGQTIEKWGYSVIGCSDGTDAWRILREKNDISLVVTDYMMPGMDGMTLTKSIRKSAVCTTIPIIMISGVLALSSISTMLDDGVSLFLPKPVAVQELREHLGDLTRDPGMLESIPTLQAY